MTSYAAAMMPPTQPLHMQEQSFRIAPKPREVLRRTSVPDLIWRGAAFVPAGLLTLSLLYSLSLWMGSGGVTTTEMLILFLVGVTFVWISLPVSTAVLGLLRRLFRARRRTPRTMMSETQRVAILVPVYNESTSEVLGNIRAMMGELAQRSESNSYSVFVLSDSNDAAVTAQEERAIAELRALCPWSMPLYYRRRAVNTDKKVGNITDWIVNWGGGYDAMLVLDSDSLMSGSAIRNLARALHNDPDAGLIQSFPIVIGAETLFGRMQQFSNAVYGWLLAEGLSLWSQSEGNYWGHNAIIRIQAFAQSAQLPYLNGRRGQQQLVLSHDFVEAGLLRRAGWTVRFEPQAGGSYEETPQTLVDYALRDRRWCQGNLQHLRLLNARGFHVISRFHMLQGAVAFLLSPAWLILIAIWATAGWMPTSADSYFSAANPLYPVWPEMARIKGEVFLAMIYMMLLLPKLLSIAAMCTSPRIRRSYGGTHRFVATALVEIVLSIIYAPILMVQQTIAVWRAVFGRSGTWLPQSRGVSVHSWRVLARFHMIDTLIGLILGAGIVLGYATHWLIPIAGSLILSVPLSWLSALPVKDLPFQVLRLDAPHTLREPRIIASARRERQFVRDRLDAGPSLTPAE